MKHLLAVTIALFLVNSALLAKPPHLKNGGKIIKLLPSKANIYYDIGYEEGLKQVIAISRSAKFEDCWIYIEEQKRWYDVGDEGDEDSVSVDLCIIKNSPDLKKVQKIIDIHIHPDYSKSKKISIPSFEDLKNAVSNKGEFRAHGTKFINMVADGFGTWEFDSGNTRLDSNLEKKYDALFERFCCEVHSPTSMSREQKIERIISEFRSIGLKLIFTKFK